MAKNTKALSGPAKRKYFRDVLQADAGVSPDAAKRLADKFDSEVSQMRVRQHKALPAGAKSQPTVEVKPPVAATPDTEAPSMPPTAPVFDPHAFSLIVVMSKQGADGLKARLETIESLDNLKALARAQHIAVDATEVDPVAMRAAIIAGTAQRIADRRAAAS